MVHAGNASRPYQKGSLRFPAEFWTSCPLCQERYPPQSFQAKPLHFCLDGSDALSQAASKPERLTDEFGAWRDLRPFTDGTANTEDQMNEHIHAL